MTQAAARGGLVLRLTLLLTGTVLVAGILALGVTRILIRRLEAGRQAEAMETLLSVSSASATTACFANDDGIAGQVVQDLVATRQVAVATVLAERTVLAEARLEGASPGPLRFRRKLFSPFNPELQVGELVLAPTAGQVERSAAAAESMMWTALVYRTLALAAIVALVLNLALVPPFRAQLRALRALDPAGPARLQPGLLHRGDEFAQLAEAVNGILDRFQHVLGAARDEQAGLLQDKHKVQAMLEHLDEGLFLLRGDGALDLWTPAFLRLLDLQHTPPQAGTPVHALPGDGAGAIARCLAECRAGAAEAAEVFRLRRPPPEDPAWLRLRLQRIGPDWLQGRLEALNLHDTQPASAEGRDPATGVLNRFGADLAIEDHFANHATGLGLLLVALDPDLPEEAVRRLSAPLAPGDQVARLDKGKYLVLMEDLDGAGRAQALGRRIQAELETPWTGARVQARLGEALWKPEDEPSRSELLRRAEAALRQATPLPGTGEQGA